MGRTGTQSLTKALQILELNVVHYPNDQETLLHIQTGHFRLPRLETCDGITDTVVVPYYAQFDNLYPDSRFILTAREIESWLRSGCKDHGGASEDPMDPNEMSAMRFNAARFSSGCRTMCTKRASGNAQASVAQSIRSVAFFLPRPVAPAVRRRPARNKD